MSNPNLEARPQIARTLGLVAALCVGVGLGACTKTNKDVTPPDTTGASACSEEAMVCPDGSSVSRSGAECEFEACPDADDGDGEPAAADAGEPDAEPAAEETPEGAAG